MSPPEFATSLETPAAWQHWQGQNWHSFLEQSYGFVNGLGVALALAVLLTRVPRREVAPVDRRSLILTLILLVPVLAYVNLIKNVGPWTTQHGEHVAIPDTMQAPGIDFSLSATGWFNFFFAAAALSYTLVILWHFRRPIALLSNSWLARGQLLYLLLLWVFAIGNLARVLPAFTQGRLLTEGVILLNAVLVSFLVLVVPRGSEDLPLRANPAWARSILAATVIAALLLIAVPAAEFSSVRRVYGDSPTGKRGFDFRLGPNANWKREPLLRETPHR